LKSERWGSLLFQEKYHGERKGLWQETACNNNNNNNNKHLCYILLKIQNVIQLMSLHAQFLNLGFSWDLLICGIRRYKRKCFLLPEMKHTRPNKGDARMRFPVKWTFCILIHCWYVRPECDTKVGFRNKFVNYREIKFYDQLFMLE
jgi:hypothetical protein